MRSLLITAALLLLSLAGNGYQLYKAGGAEPKCDVKLAAQVNQQDTATQQDQHKADQKALTDLTAKLKKREQDAQSDSDTLGALNTRLHAQEKTLRDYQARQDDICLRTAVPDALIGSLHIGAGGIAVQPPG